MKIAGHPQDRLRMGLAEHHGSGQPRQHHAQAKAPIEAKGRLIQIAPCVFALSDGMVAAADDPLDGGATTRRLAERQGSSGTAMRSNNSSGLLSAAAEFQG